MIVLCPYLCFARARVLYLRVEISWHHKEHREVWSVLRFRVHVSQKKDVRQASGHQIQNRCFSCLEELRPWQGNKGFSESEGIMSALSILASSLSALFGLYCVIWGIVASSMPAQERAGSVFLGVLFLLLAFVYVRVIRPREQ
jgi:hypothetical protein